MKTATSLFKIIFLEKRLPHRLKQPLLYVLAALRLKWLYWHVKGKKADLEEQLGYKKCKFLFKFECRFQKRLLRESDYKKRAEMYNEFYTTFYDLFAKFVPEKDVFGFNPSFINQYTELFENKVVIDYGCGYGNSTELLSKKGKFVYGIDASSTCIEIASNRLKGLKNVSFKLNPSPYLTLGDEIVDSVYSNDLLEHLHPWDAKMHFEEVFRVLKKGGRYLFWTPGSETGPNDCTQWFYPRGKGFKSKGTHIKEYTSAELIRILKNIGYSKVELPDLEREVLMIATK